MSGNIADYGSIRIDGTHYKLAGNPGIPFRALDRFAPKFTIGDYSYDNNDLLSAWIINDLTGGHGIADLKEGTDTNRYRIGTLYTRYPSQWTKPFLITNATWGSGSVYPLGDMNYNGTYEFYSSSNAKLFRDGVDTGISLNRTPDNPSVAWSGTSGTALLYIPYSVTGYTTYNRGAGTSTDNLGAGNRHISFCVWDDKLIAIDVFGQMRYATTAAATTTFTSYGTGGKLDDAITPKRLHVHRNASGDPTIFVVTDQGVWALDADIPKLYKIPDFESVHPKFGNASCVWRGAMYVSAGMDILEYSGGVIRNVGLSRDDGLPYAEQGTIVSLLATQNSMYALVNGSSLMSVHEYSGFGWCKIFEYTNTHAPTALMVSRAGGTQKIYWGQDASGSIWYQNIPVNFTNPREAIAAGGFDFGLSTGAGLTYDIQTGRFDAGMRGYRKIANAVQIRVRSMPGLETIKVYYRVDTDTSWTQLGSDIVTAGVHNLLFGTADAQGVYPGISFETIELKVAIVDDSTPTGNTSVIESMVFSFLKLQNPSLTWDIQIDCTAPFHDQSPATMISNLMTLRTSDRFYAIEYGGTTYRGRIAQVSGIVGSGLDSRGTLQLSLVEVPEVLGLE